MENKNSTIFITIINLNRGHYSLKFHLDVKKNMLLHIIPSPAHKKLCIEFSSILTESKNFYRHL